MSELGPGSTIGVLGSGQLGRMLAMAARRMGYRVQVLSPEADTPTGHLSDVEHVRDYHDAEGVAAFARQVDVVTFEFENVPFETAEIAGRFAPLRPAGRVVHTAQNRHREKAFFDQQGLPTAPHRFAAGLEELAAAVDALGLPVIAKTAAWGYDGKGQVRIADRRQIEAAWTELGGQDLVVEGVVDFSHEASMVGARGLDGEIALFPLTWNTHERHILDISVAPALLESRIAARAAEITRAVLEGLDVVGVLCVEFFVTAGGALMINEMAPRPHNSGHLTIEGCATSQFEQQLRAICGLPLGSTELVGPTAMANLLGDLWEGGEPNWPAALRQPGVALHLYGKAEPRPGRKMGHLTARATTVEDARAAVARARQALLEP